MRLERVWTFGKNSIQISLSNGGTGSWHNKDLFYIILENPAAEFKTSCKQELQFINTSCIKVAMTGYNLTIAWITVSISADTSLSELLILCLSELRLQSHNNGIDACCLFVFHHMAPS